MGRNITVDYNNVPVGGIIQLNFSKGLLYKNSDGKEYLGTFNNQSVLNLSNYPKFNALVNSNFITNSTIGPALLQGYYQTGTPVWNFQNLSPGTIGNSSGFCCIPWNSDTNTKAPNGTIGNYKWQQTLFATYLWVSSGAAYNSAYVFNTSTNRIVSVITDTALVTWYDSSTSKLRCIGYNRNAGAVSPVNINSTDGITFTNTSITGFPSTGFNSSWATNPNYGTMAFASDSLVLLMPYNGGYQLYMSTDSGVTFTDRSTAYSGSATFNSSQRNALNYNGTTLFIANPNATNIMRYSTDSGTTWSNSTVSGTTSSPSNPYNYPCFAQGATSSILMFADSSRTAIYYSADGGQSWTTTNYPTTPTGYSNLTPLSLVYSGGSWYLSYGVSGLETPYSAIFMAKSTDNGATWTSTLISGRASSGSFGPGQSMGFVFSGVFYFASTLGIWRSTDAITWTQIYTGSVNLGTKGADACELTSFIQIGNIVINKSTQVCTPLTSNMQYSNMGATPYLMSIGSDFACALPASTGVQFYMVRASADATTYGTYAPPYSSALGSGTDFSHASAYEYMRIK